MQLTTRITVIIFSLFLMSGCMHASKRGTSSNLVDYLYPEGEKVSMTEEQTPHLTLPLRVGIAFVPEQQAHNPYSLQANEKQALLQKVAERFKAESYIQKIEIIPELYLRQGKGFQTIKQISQLHGVDVMALVSYDNLTVNDDNALSLTYWTIVGAYIFPGETSRSSTFVDTAVFDVKTQKLLFRAPGMAQAEKMHTAVGKFETNSELMKQTFNEAVDQMNNNLSNELSNFKTRVKEEQIATVSYRPGFSGGGGSAGWYGLLFLVLLSRFARNPK